MLAVIELNAASHEPQSRSIACLVASEVVSGPGVSRIGSLPTDHVVSPQVLAAVSRQRLRAPDQPPSRRTNSKAGDGRRGQHDQRRHRGRRTNRARLVELQDRDRRERGLRRIQEHNRRDRRHRVDEIIAANVEDRRQAHRHRDAPERLVKRHLQRGRHRLELAVDLFQCGDRRQMARRIEVHEGREHQDRHRSVQQVQRIRRRVEEQDVADAEHHARHRHRQHRLEADQRPQQHPRRASFPASRRRRR